MSKKTRILIGLIASIALFCLGIFYLFNETLSPHPIITYLFTITGVLGALSNYFQLRKIEDM
ncbi:hypothetical protein [Evansella halocellulosilytica]|uniref:hypothetical protein n=1 Tax=Evansella halocellulosilytica TaxID=2011013 RepID=UPI000BB7699C|nr:hypothetical protein [Evansella halocellulosilytica]